MTRRNQRVLLTGAFGNVGTSVLTEIAGRGHQVRGFDIDGRSNRRLAARHDVEAHWGDIRNPE